MLNIFKVIKIEVKKRVHSPCCIRVETFHNEILLRSFN